MLIKDGKAYAINAHKDEEKLSLVIDYQAKIIMGIMKKFVSIFFERRKVLRRRKTPRDEGILGRMWWQVELTITTIS